MYTNIETEKADFRIIWSLHIKPAQATQLPKSCTGILLEEGFYDPDNLFIGIRGNHETPYRDIMATARKKRISLVALEATDNPSTSLYFANNNSEGDEMNLAGKVKNTLYKLVTLPYFAPNWLLGDLEGEMKREDIVFKTSDFMKLYRKMIDRLAGREEHDAFVVSYRNLIFAQTANAFADFQISTGIERPSLALVVGAGHKEVVKTLEMSEEERVRRILSSPFINSFQADTFHLRYFLTYRAWQGWVRDTFEDPKLKLAGGG